MYLLNKTIYVSKLKSYQSLVTKNGRNSFRKKEYTTLANEIIMQLGKVKIPEKAILSIELDLFFKYPKSYSKKKKEALESQGNYHFQKPDGDNVAKFINDVVSERLGYDDKNVAMLSVNKYYTQESNEHFKIKIKKLGEEC